MVSLIHRRKLRKSNRSQPSRLEDEIAKVIYDLEINNQKLKYALQPLSINSAKEVAVGRTHHCVIVFYPLRFMRKMHKIQASLITELEKKFSGRQFVFIAQRKINQRSKRAHKAQLRPRCRTMMFVHESILDDLLYPLDVVGKRIKHAIDGSKLLKIFLDAKIKNKVENRLETYAAVYKKLTKKETSFGFMTNITLQQVL